jgi:poly [ADP-ribose] polymerase
MDYDDEDAEELEAALKKTIKNKQGQTIAPSELPAPTQNLMKLIFNHDMFQEAMQNFNIDTQKMPLGKISKSMIQRGYDVLEDIENVIRVHVPHAHTLSHAHAFSTRRLGFADSLL